MSLSLCPASPSVVRTSLFRSAGARCGLERRENASKSETMRPTRAVSDEIRLRYLRNSASRPGGYAPLAIRRSSSMERLSTPETGLLISCATLAESCQAIGLDELALGSLQLLGALFHLALQRLLHFVQLGDS